MKPVNAYNWKDAIFITIIGGFFFLMGVASGHNIMIFFGGIPLAVGLVLLFKTKKAKENYAKLLVNGVRIMAPVLAVKTIERKHSNSRGTHKHYRKTITYKIILNKIIEDEHSDEYYESEELKFHPGLLAGKELPLVYDSADPSIYFVDLESVKNEHKNILKKL